MIDLLHPCIDLMFALIAILICDGGTRKSASDRRIRAFYNFADIDVVVGGLVSAITNWMHCSQPRLLNTVYIEAHTWQHLVLIIERFRLFQTFMELQFELTGPLFIIILRCTAPSLDGHVCEKKFFYYFHLINNDLHLLWQMLDCSSKLLKLLSP